MGFPTGGVLLLFVALMAGFLAVAEFCGRWGDATEHQELPQEEDGIELEETVNVTQAMAAFEDAISELQGAEEQGKPLSVEKTAAALRKMDHARPTAEDVQRLGAARNHKSTKGGRRLEKMQAASKHRGKAYP